MSTTLTALDDTSFAKTIAASPGKVVIVDFWGDWCAPCKQLTPKLEAMAATMPQATFTSFECGTRTGTAIPSQFGITNLPVVLAIKDGEVVADLRGDVRRIVRDLPGIIAEHS